MPVLGTGRCWGLISQDRLASSDDYQTSGRGLNPGRRTRREFAVRHRQFAAASTDRSLARSQIRHMFSVLCHRGNEEQWRDGLQLARWAISRETFADHGVVDYSVDEISSLHLVPRMHSTSCGVDECILVVKRRLPTTGHRRPIRGVMVRVWCGRAYPRVAIGPYLDRSRALPRSTSNVTAVIHHRSSRRVDGAQPSTDSSVPHRESPRRRPQPAARIYTA